MALITETATREPTALSSPLEQVMRQVLAMKQAGDIDGLIRVVWDVLTERNFDFVSCALLLMDEERDWLTSYNVWGEQLLNEHLGTVHPQRHTRRLGDGLWIFSGQISLKKAPSLYRGAVSAWRHGTVEKHRLSTAEIEEISRLNEQRYDLSFSARTYPIRFHLHIPFTYGVFTLRSRREEAEQFSDEQINFLQRLVEILSLGYVRYREFLGMERESTVQRLRAEVQTMQRSDDIVDLMGRLWEELQRAGINFQYMSIAVEDEDEDDDCVHLYAASHSEYSYVTFWNPLHKKSDISADVDLYYRPILRSIWKENHTDFVGVHRVENQEMAAYTERTKQLWEGDKREGDRKITDSVYALAMVAAALPQGRIVVIQIQKSPQDPPPDFTPEDQQILESFAEALGLGFSRFFDFQRLERHNRRLQEERALERVRAEILRMEQSADILRIVRLIWNELSELGHDFGRYSISMFDEERDLYSGYFTTRLADWFSIPLAMHSTGILDDHSFSHSLEYKLSNEGGPYREELLDAWRRGEIFQGELRNAGDKEVFADFSRRVYSIEIDAERMPDTSFLYVPFAHGVIGGFLYDSDGAQFAEEEIALFHRFGETFGEGYTRFQELRQREVQRGVERLCAEVASMRQSSDIAEVAVLLGKQLQDLGVEFFGASFSIIDEEAGRMHLYSVGPSGTFDMILSDSPFITTADLSNIDDLADLGSAVRLKEIIPGFNFFYTTEDLHDSPVLAERGSPPRIVHRNEEEMQRELVRYKRRWRTPDYPIERVGRSVIRVPFSHGTIALVHFEANRFTQRDLDIVVAYADAISLGFTRFHDFQRLERHNRELEIERAVGRVQIAVQNMGNSTDIVPVITLLSLELQSLSLDNTWCTISLIDHEAQKVRIYGTIGSVEQSLFKSEVWAKLIENSGQKELSFSSDTVERIENEEGPFYITGIPGSRIEHANYMSAPLDSYHGQLQETTETTIISRSDEEMEKISREYIRCWKIDEWPDELMLRSVLRTPFSGGTIAVSDPRPNHFSGRDARIVERFAEAFSLGYARYLDFRNMERRNRELEIERAVGRVQIAVQNMGNSTDIVLVMPLFYEAMQRLGLDYGYFSVSIVDQVKERVQVYVTGEFLHQWHKKALVPYAREEFGPHIVEKLEREEGPIFFAGMGSEQQNLYVHYTNRPLDSYHGRLQQTQQTTIISRSEEELRQVLPELQKIWKAENWPEEAWPEEIWPRSVIRVPFAGGTIALSDSRPDQFSERDARVLERFAEAFTLGYTRYLDFRRLEEQNRALEAASRIKSEFLANMSHELRTPMNAIINFSSMVLDGICGEISDDVRDVVGEIDQNSDRLLELINDVLDLSKIEAGAMQLERAPCDPVACVENAVDALAHSAKEKNLAISMDVEELPPILADERRLTQHVLVNLIKNAIKFTQQGSIEVGTRRENGSVLFWVKDTGIGIPEAEQVRIFETFHQVDGSITRQAEGTGLGLAIAYKFVELHRGRIWVESEEGKGSTFYFTVPAEN